MGTGHKKSMRTVPEKRTAGQRSRQAYPAGRVVAVRHGRIVAVPYLMADRLFDSFDEIAAQISTRFFGEFDSLIIDSGRENLYAPACTAPGLGRGRCTRRVWAAPAWRSRPITRRVSTLRPWATACAASLL